MECLVESDFIYLPLLFDPEIEKEIQTIFRPGKQIENYEQPGSKTIIKHQDKYFVKTLNLNSLLENYEAIDAYSYKRIRNDVLQKYQLTEKIDDFILDPTLTTILFQVMPYFIKTNKIAGYKRNLNEEKILELIGRKINIPERYYEKALKFQDVKPLKKILAALEGQKPIHKPPHEGLIFSQKFREWFHNALYTKILADESARLKNALQIRHQFDTTIDTTRSEHIAILLCITDTGNMEIDGFGFKRINSKREYFVYKRTGEYVLKDYYGRSYLFPDCRVAVSTYMPYKPLVLEKYKHPFLPEYKSEQEICIKGYNVSKEVTAKNIIRVLEDGLTALRYGYKPGLRNGYHSLDKTWVHIPTIDFEDYRI